MRGLLPWLLLLGVACFDSEPLSRNPEPGSGPVGGVLELAFRAGEPPAPTPVRAEVRGADGSDYVAGDALPVGGHCIPGDAPPGSEELAALRSSAVPNAWAGARQFYADGAARLELPAGRYRVRVEKGFEHRVATREYRLEAGETLSDVIVLERWSNLPAEGWFGADGHLHVARSRPEDDAWIATWMRAEDLHVANLLQWGTYRGLYGAPQYAFGEAGARRSGAATLLLAGQEAPRTHVLGHLVVLGAEAPFQPDPYLDTRGVFETAHALGGLAGYAHFGEAFGARRGLALDLPHEIVDFIEVVQVGRARYDTWYEALNAGLRIAPTAGSDYPCGEALPGSERFYTRVDGPLTRETWLEGVRRLRTFASNGPLLRFRVEDAGMGDVLRLPAAGPVSVEGEVRFDPQRDDVGWLELVQEGVVVQRVLRAGGAPRIELRATLPVERATWLALRAGGVQEHVRGTPGLRIGLDLREPEPPGPLPAAAHSAPVFIEIEGLPPLRDTPTGVTSRALWRQRREVLAREIESAFSDVPPLPEGAGGVPRSLLEASRPLLRAALEAADRRDAGPGD